MNNTLEFIDNRAMCFPRYCYYYTNIIKKSKRSLQPQVCFPQRAILPWHCRGVDSH